MSDHASRRGDRPASVPRRGLALLSGLAVLLVTGCLGEPKIEDRWTRLDVLGSSVQPNQAMTPGSTPTFQVRTSITYRSILTGFAVAELRASGSVTAAEVGIHPEGTRLPMAQDIDRVLLNSVSIGRATRAVTGWDHLIQTIDFSFPATIPGASDSTANGLFLVCYLGQGDEIELPGGADSLVVTPFSSTQYEILPVGMELLVSSGTP